MTHWLTDNLKSRDASASKKTETKKQLQKTNSCHSYIVTKSPTHLDPRLFWSVFWNTKTKTTKQIWKWYDDYSQAAGTQSPDNRRFFCCSPRVPSPVSGNNNVVHINNNVTNVFKIFKILKFIYCQIVRWPQWPSMSSISSTPINVNINAIILAIEIIINIVSGVITIHDSLALDPPP